MQVTAVRRGALSLQDRRLWGALAANAPTCVLRRSRQHILVPVFHQQGPLVVEVAKEDVPIATPPVLGLCQRKRRRARGCRRPPALFSSMFLQGFLGSSHESCPTPSSRVSVKPAPGVAVRDRPHYCRRMSLINAWRGSAISEEVSVAGRILHEITQQFARPNRFCWVVNSRRVLRTAQTSFPNFAELHGQAGSFGWLPLLNTATKPSGTGRASRKGQRLQRHLPAEACCFVVCDQPPGQPNPIRAHLVIPCTEPNPKFLYSALKSAPWCVTLQISWCKEAKQSKARWILLCAVPLPGLCPVGHRAGCLG